MRGCWRNRRKGPPAQCKCGTPRRARVGARQARSRNCCAKEIRDREVPLTRWRKCCVLWTGTRICKMIQSRSASWFSRRLDRSMHSSAQKINGALLRMHLLCDRLALHCGYSYSLFKLTKAYPRTCWISSALKLHRDNAHLAVPPAARRQVGGVTSTVRG